MERTIDYYYKSLSKEILNRKDELGLKRDEILKDPNRVTDIIKNSERPSSHPYMIGKKEHRFLYDLFLYKNKKDFISEGVLSVGIDTIKMNYDKMLWDHINWKEMYKIFIEELKSLSANEELKKQFNYALIDYVPFARIYFNDFHPEFGKIWIPKEERDEIYEQAVKWVFFRYGHKKFEKFFLSYFSGKTLHEFDDNFLKFTADFLDSKKPNDFSFGLSVYKQCKEISYFVVLLQSFDEYKYEEMYKEISSETSEKINLLKSYISERENNLKKLERNQQQFDTVFKDDLTTNEFSVEKLTTLNI
ncbi:MAG: hypothetical protein LBE23_00425 [Vagococcus sp.]|jgi:hypothetical protein|nr:hypothetical protein [Vagococcus sp.]